MITVDYVLLSIFVLSAIIGIFRGFVREAISLVGWIVAVWGAWRYGAHVSAWLPDFVDDVTLKIWAARLLVLIGVLIISGLTSRVVSFLVDRTGLSGTDRMVGMVFGLARGMVLAGLAVNLLEVAGFAEEPWWPESKLIPYLAPVAQRLSDIADEGLDMLDKPIDQIESPIALP
jgi:membrane protein required for colicin V production